jgi:hypothetical protein
MRTIKKIAQDSFVESTTSDASAQVIQKIKSDILSQTQTIRLEIVDLVEMFKYKSRFILQISAITSTTIVLYQIFYTIRIWIHN